MTNIFEIVSDNFSNHNLPIGAHVFKVPAPAWSINLYWYTMDDPDLAVAVDARDMVWVYDDEDEQEPEEEDMNEPEYYDPSWDYPEYDSQTDFYESTGRMQFPNEY